MKLLCCGRTHSTSQTTVTQKCQRTENPQHSNLKLLCCGFSGRWHLWATVYTVDFSPHRQVSSRGQYTLRPTIWNLCHVTDRVQCEWAMNWIAANFQRKYPYFWRYANYLFWQCRIGGRKLPWQKNSSIRSSVSIEHRLVTDADRQTDRQMQSHV